MTPAAVRRAFLALLLIGLAWRVTRWAIAMPLWGDEAYLGMSLLDRSFRELTEPLEYQQVAPLLFLWAEKAVVLVSTSERAVRLVPTLASIAGLLLFARLARRLLPPVAAVLALGFLASAYYTTRHGSELKPYSLDLLASVLVLSLAVSALERREASAPLVALSLAAPLLVGFSYPSVFVLGSAGLALLLDASRRRDRARALLSLAVLVVSAGALGLSFRLAAAAQDRASHDFMREWWRGGLPPAALAEWPAWLLSIHTGNLMAYPVGGKNGASTLTLLVFVLGAALLWRTHRRRLLALLLLPFALTFVAALLSRYPYGESARVSQHLAPSICLLAGAGAAWLAERVASWPSRLPLRLAPHAAVALLGAVGLGEITYAVVKPYKVRSDVEVRRVVLESFAREKDHRIVTIGPPNVRFRWYLRAGGGRVESDPPEVVSTGDTVAVLVFDSDPERAAGVIDALSRRGFAKTEDVEYRLPLSAVDFSTYCRALRFVRERGAAAS